MLCERRRGKEDTNISFVFACEVNHVIIDRWSLQNVAANGNLDFLAEIY